MRERHSQHCRTNKTWACAYWWTALLTSELQILQLKPSKQLVLAFPVMTLRARRDEGFTPTNCGANDSLRDAATVVSQDVIYKCFTENAHHNQGTLTELAVQTSINLLFQFSQQLSDFLPRVCQVLHYIFTDRGYAQVYINTYTEIAQYASFIHLKYAHTNRMSASFYTFLSVSIKLFWVI